MEFPDPEALDVVGKVCYQDCVRALMNMYSGVWWSGDESGQHQHVDLRGNEEEHGSLCRGLGAEWLQIIQDLPVTTFKSCPDDLENHKKFIEGFEAWLDSRALQQIIMAGSASEGMACLMYNHLNPQRIPSTLTGRRLAVTQRGKVGVVPRSVQAGDVIVQLAGSLNLLVLRQDQRLRNQNIARDIKTALRARNDDESINADQRLRVMQRIDLLDVKNSTLVGECYVDGEVGWKLHQAWDLGIFALR
ncbi:uncharacterized protein RAG0_13153 [Rhynchosporium agropyri]|uniref:Uncharacterized protein n=1 Tax=Rhynchosporium agropyri TaxID=914238 RepID=A0A1E1LDM7_9HELO|nr:uncharacterized protein RAG0_13153 [Rhynchosporium agropyri]